MNTEKVVKLYDPHSNLEWGGGHQPNEKVGKYETHNFCICFLCPPLKKAGHIALHMSVGMSVGMYVSIP